MVFVVYKTTNKVTGEYYYGQHRTEDFEKDSYFGSGKLLAENIKKYGKENFTREVIEEFATREAALLLEKSLIMSNKSDKLCLNRNDGGGAALYTDKMHQDYLEQYEANPQYCKKCGKKIPYDAHWENDFCSHTCAASYNNEIRELVVVDNPEDSNYGRRKFTCPVCGKVEIIPRSDPKKYCSISCGRKANNREKTPIQQKLDAAKDDILHRVSEGQSYSTIAEFYGVTKQRIYESIKRWKNT